MRFPTFGAVCVFSRAWHQLHIFPRLTTVMIGSLRYLHLLWLDSFWVVRTLPSLQWSPVCQWKPSQHSFGVLRCSMIWLKSDDKRFSDPGIIQNKTKVSQMNLESLKIRRQVSLFQPFLIKPWGCPGNGARNLWRAACRFSWGFPSCSRPHSRTTASPESGFWSGKKCDLKRRSQKQFFWM